MVINHKEVGHLKLLAIFIHTSCIQILCTDVALFEGFLRVCMSASLFDKHTQPQSTLNHNPVLPYTLY